MAINKISGAFVHKLRCFFNTIKISFLRDFFSLRLFIYLIVLFVLFLNTTLYVTKVTKQSNSKLETLEF